MNSDFDILVNGSPAPAVIRIPATFQDKVTVTLSAKAGSVAHGASVSISTNGAALPLDKVGGNLDASGQLQFVVGPSASISSALRGDFSLDIMVGSKKKPQSFQFF